VATSVPRQQAAGRIDEDAAWAAVLRRDASQDGKFHQAVVTTGIYCRPSCPARHAKRENVRFYETAAQARAAGFRACLRCAPDQDAPSRSSDAARKVCEYLDAHFDESVSLDRLGRLVGLSAAHLQRTFRKVTGLTPKEWVAARRTQRLKERLKAGESVTDATYEAGFGSGSRVYEKSDARLGMTPATYRHGGKGMHIRYAVVDSPAGRVLVGATERGACAVMMGDGAADLARQLADEYPAAEIERDDGGLAACVRAVVAGLSGAPAGAGLPLDVQGTAFQWRVWKELQRIPFGTTRSYAEIARAIGRPSAVRAVGTACGRNRVALLVPCHRVVRADGGLGGFRWGLERKKKLLEHEKRVAARAKEK